MRTPDDRVDRRLVRVLAAFLAFSVVEYTVWIVLLLYALQVAGPTGAGLVTAATLVPAVLLAPLVGSVGDRAPRGAVLAGAYFVSSLGCAALAVALAVGAPLWLVIVTAALLTVVQSVARPTHYSVLPQLASTPPQLLRANSASSLSNGVGNFAGAAVAGLGTVVVGVAGVAGVAAGVMTLASILTIALKLPAGAHGTRVSPLAHAFAGLREVAHDAPVRGLLLVTSSLCAATAALEVLAATFARDVLDADEGTQGLLVSMIGIGLVVGAGLGAFLAWRKRLAPAVVAATVAAGLPVVFLAGADSLGLALVLLFLFGSARAVADLAAGTLLQRGADDAVLARVFAVAESFLHAGFAIGAAGSAVLIGVFGATGAFVPVGVALAAISVIVWPWLRRLDGRARSRPDILALLRRVDYLHAMKPGPLDRLAQRSTRVEVLAGEAVFHQGDLGDACYVVSAGVLTVTIDDRLLSGTLQNAEAFGEIALLLDRPRTATVSAVTDATLVRLDRADFLAAVTGNPDGRQIALDVAHAHLVRSADG